MTTTRIGVVVIGQAPRSDVEAELRQVLGRSIAIDLVGALDGLSRDEIDTLAPHDGHDALFTNLPGGAGMVISKKEVTRRAQGQLEALAARGVGVTLMACTGQFPDLHPPGVVVFPSAVLTAMVRALVPRGRLGVFGPLVEQEESTRQKWADDRYTIEVMPLLPRTEGPALDAAAREMARRQPALIVMDCMGYSVAMKRRVREVAGIPTVLAVSAAARAVQELVE